MTVTYRIAVATYRRPQTIQRTTLTFLAEAGLSHLTDVWVADEIDAAEYREQVPTHLYDRLIVGVQGLVAQRNYMMSEHYPAGSWVIHCNDDVRGVSRRVNEKKLVNANADFGQLVEASCRLADAQALSLWGLYPAPNALWMKPGAGYGWHLIVGALFGQKVTGSLHSTALPAGCDDKEDHYRSALYFEAEGTLLRLNDVAVRTTYYNKGDGGMELVRTPFTSQAVVEGLLSGWPHLFAPGKPKAQYGYPEVRFKRLTI